MYYYNAKTRESAWTKPENVKIITQAEVEQMAAQANQQQVASTAGVTPGLQMSPAQCMYDGQGLFVPFNVIVDFYILCLQMRYLKT